MIGDRHWLEGLEYGYAQHCADSVRHGREARLFEEWATERTWSEFVTVARFTDLLRAYSRDDWRTHSHSGQSGAFESTVLARPEVSLQVLVQAVLVDLKAADVKAWRAVRNYVRSAHRRVAADALSRGKRFVYDWCRQAATRGAKVS